MVGTESRLRVGRPLFLTMLGASDFFLPRNAKRGSRDHLGSYSVVTGDFFGGKVARA